MDKIKACWFCPHFYYNSADAGYSDMAPGSDFGMECRKRMWEFNPYSDCQESFGEKLGMANTCPHYIHPESKS